MFPSARSAGSMPSRSKNPYILLYGCSRMSPLPRVSLFKSRRDAVETCRSGHDWPLLVSSKVLSLPTE